MWSVYQIENQTTKRSYFGCTVDVKKRVREHRLRNPHFFEGDCTVTIVATFVTQAEAYAAEANCIAASQSMVTGYNRQSGGREGYVMHPSFVKGAKRRGNAHMQTPEAIAKRAASHKGMKRSAEARARMSAANIGVKRNNDPSKRSDWPESLARMVAGRKGKAPWNKGKKSDEASNSSAKGWETRRRKAKATSSLPPP